MFLSINEPSTLGCSLRTDSQNNTSRCSVGWPPGGPIPFAWPRSVSRAFFTHTVPYFPALDVLSSA